MDRILNSVPKAMLVFLLIAGGILFIVISDPPHSVCDSQMEAVIKMQAGFLKKDPKSKTILTTKYERLRDQCKLTNNPGGCYELFQELKTMIHDLATVPAECTSRIGSVPEFKKAMWESVELVIQLAWGEKPPESYNAKFGWLETADMSLYCQLKNRIVGVFGESQWNSFREKTLTALPGAQPLNRNQLWDMSLFSENCARYP